MACQFFLNQKCIKRCPTAVQQIGHEYIMLLYLCKSKYHVSLLRAFIMSVSHHLVKIRTSCCRNKIQ